MRNSKPRKEQQLYERQRAKIQVVITQFNEVFREADGLHKYLVLD